MNNDALVSVIITTYKRESAMIKRAISSVQNQTHKNLEIIVVDDSPNDFSQREDVKNIIANLKDFRITYIQHEKNQGACVARNTGIAIANGQFVMYVDDDDEIIPTNIEKRLNKFYADDIGLVYSRTFLANDNTDTMTESKQKMCSGIIFDQLIKENFIGAFPLMRRECFDVCGMFNVTMQSAQDIEMWLRIAQKYKIEYVDEPLSIVHIHSGERITTNYYKRIQGLEKINESYKDYLNKHKSAKCIRYLKLAPFYAGSGERSKAMGVWLIGFKAAPYKVYTNLKYLYLLVRKCKKK